jgi:uridine kinase
MNLETKIIGIAGASGAGKSLLSQQLYDGLREIHSQSDVDILHEDAYYRQRNDIEIEARAQINYDHPEAFEHSLLIEHLVALKNGRPVDVPQYDYSLHNRKSETTQLKPTKILILEGILILHDPKLRELLDLKIFVDVPMDICLSRRLRRDIEERSRTLDSVLSQYHATVRPMFFEFIDPSKEHADIIVPRGGENRNALNVLHTYLDRLLAQVPERL